MKNEKERKVDPKGLSSGEFGDTTSTRRETDIFKKNLPKLPILPILRKNKK